MLRIRNSLYLSIFIFLAFASKLYPMMNESRSGVFSSDKAVNELVRNDDSFLFRFGSQSILKVFIGELSFVKRIYSYYSLSTQIKSSLKKGYDYHSVEFHASRGFTDGKIYGLLSVGYRLGHFDKKEQWLVFSTGTGFIPSPYGIESSITYYHSLTSDRYGRLRAEVLGLYRVGKGSTYFDLGLQTSFYLIPSGECGVPDVTGIDEDNAIIEEFIQFEGGMVIGYTFKNSIVFKLLVTNILFINQKNYEVANEDGSASRKYRTNFSYAPKAMLELSFKI